MGKLSIGKHESFEGEFVGGQPRGRGKYKAKSGWTFEGTFIGLRPAGGSHVYKATHKGKGDGGEPQRLADLRTGGALGE